ncbi:alanine--tRNA ligase-related protein, partial [Paenibacillus xylanexedens]|uniref:alanine--tRNA ligase-related protein n=1 Tax=Paenibacillus xylanexedens TaxID=528191 RepID=UPI0021B440D6
MKEERVRWGWELVRRKEWMGLDGEGVCVRVYGEDEEALKVWNEKVGVGGEGMMKLDEKLWDMGEGGCGGCREILYDGGEGYGNEMSDGE